MSTGCCDVTRVYVVPLSNKCQLAAVVLHAGEEARRQLHKNAASNIEQVLAETTHKAPTIQPPASHHKNYPN